MSSNFYGLWTLIKRSCVWTGWNLRDTVQISQVLDVLLKRKKRIKPSDLKNVLDKKQNNPGTTLIFFSTVFTSMLIFWTLSCLLVGNLTISNRTYILYVVMLPLTILKLAWQLKIVPTKVPRVTIIVALNENFSQIWLEDSHEFSDSCAS